MSKSDLVNKVELIKSGQGNIFSYFLSLKNYNRILKYLTDMKGLTPNEQRDLFEFLAFNLIGRTVMRDIRKLRKFNSGSVYKIGTFVYRKLLLIQYQFLNHV